MTVQGCSIHTKNKIDMFEKILDIMNHEQKHRIIDLFCGGGVNHTDIGLIRGTPSVLLKKVKNSNVSVRFSDIDGKKINKLRTNIKNWNNGKIPKNFHFEKRDAAYMLSGHYLMDRLTDKTTVIVDPNGLKELPFKDIIQLREMHVDFNMILYTNDWAFDTNTKHPIRKKGKKFGWWIDDIEDKVDFYCKLADVFKNGWIQEKSKGRAGWRMSVWFSNTNNTNLESLGMFQS